ncbi:hypothetical protein GCM10008012_26030 [Rhizobium anhuiense]|uniref:ATP-binding protein n=2 Tax=Rhizobium anhuiense TaxID=1184720 RepID=A0A3S0SA09_9HYPH|nr:ATP-binding protein [Rhizobium anhuiense]GGD81002.1 hypothetical protein GCM10008012_26030 [Rhizobium anhuiense]
MIREPQVGNVMSEFSIAVSPRAGGRYKSISNIVWDKVPGFAILTGRNGSGKTQILELLAYHFSGAQYRPGTDDPLPVIVSTAGVTYGADEIAYVPSSGKFSGGVPSSVAEIPNVRNQFVTLAQPQNVRGNRQQIDGAIKVGKVLKRLGSISPHQLTTEVIAEIFPDDFEFAIDDIDITSGINHLFVAYRLKALEALEQGTPGVDRVGKPLGPAPWSVVNDTLKVAGFPFVVVSPEETPILSQYELKLRDTQTGATIRAIDLSSGEKVLLQLVLWLFTAGKEGIFPKLLLLDEPDAHLHPSMTTQFLDVISETLVKKYGVRVIMTSHSPSTVALAPIDAVFELERGSSVIKPVSSRSDIISILTAGLVTVTKTTKFCFVEDEDDVEFYTAIQELLSASGPTRDPMALPPSPALAFLPVSIGVNASKISGGSTVVAKWVGKLDGEPLDRMFCGIIDRDGGAPGTDRIFPIGRYSFENYLLDPLVVYALLMEENQAPKLPGINLMSGDEHLLRTQPEETLQAIVDTVTAAVEASEPSIAGQGKLEVTYTAGHKLFHPRWVIDHRGHDLLRVVQRAFLGPQHLNPRRLIKCLRRCRMIPVELAVLMKAIQER